MTIRLSYREESKKDYGHSVSSPSGVTLEQLNSGSLMRIADAVEKMSASYDAMRNDRDNYKRLYASECNANESLKRSNAALRGVIRKLKLKGAV